MLRRSLLIFLLSLSPTLLPAAERWIPIAGTVGAFHTDVRVLNPSTTKDIVVSAHFFPAGNVSNRTVLDGDGVTITIPKREMRVLDDVTTLFNTTQLGAIRLSSFDEFTASSRIYAQTDAGTLGQSFVAEPASAAATRGTIVQLESTSAFRTNFGAVNVANSTSNITWNLHDKNNAIVATITNTMPAYAVIAPTNIAAFFNASAADLSDAWISFASSNPLFVYGSVVDNATTDPTSIPAQRDLDPTDTAVLATTGAFFALNVANISASTTWYTEKLGLRVVLQSPAGSSPAVVGLEGGGLIVELIQRSDAQAPGTTQRHGFTKAGVIVNDFEAALAALAARGVPIFIGPFPATREQRANAIIQDNAGNLIQLFGPGLAR